MSLGRPLAGHAVVSRVDGHAFAMIDGDAVIMSGDTGRFHVTAATGAVIWTLLDTPRSMDEIVSGLVARFDVDATRCRADVEEFVASLVDRNLVTVVEP